MESSLIFLLCICSVGFVLNTVVVTYILQKKLYQTPFNKCYLNLAIADLLFASSGFLTVYVAHSRIIHTTSNTTILMLFIVVNEVVLPYLQVVNLWSILPITCNRLNAIWKPLSYPLSKLYVIYISLCWITPAFYITLQVVLTNNQLSQKKDRYPIESFYLAQSIIFCLLPLIFSTATFAYIIHFVRRKSHMIRRQGVTIFRAVTTTICFSASWIPVAFTCHVLKKPIWTRLIPMLYLNTLSDPFIYMMPDSVLRKIYLLTSLKSSLASRSNGQSHHTG